MHLQRPPTWVVVVALATGALLLAPCIALWIVLGDAPMPASYPGVDAHFRSDAASCCNIERGVYDVAAPIAHVQAHYDRKMQRYCQDTWVWSDDRSTAEQLGLHAYCITKRGWFSEFFAVSLWSTSDTMTHVQHEETRLAP